MFKYLGITISSNGSLGLHQQAVSVKSRVAAREVALLFRTLDIRDLFRLRLYLQSFVDGQFYGLELLALPVAREIERARKIFMCETFRLPCSTARNLVYVVFPVIPAVFLLAKRQPAFYKQAQGHDLDCVKEAFLFDMTYLYPHDSSWTAQFSVILKELGLNMDDRRMNFIELCERAVGTTADVEDLCFRHVRASDEKTLSFFRLFPNAATARDFRTFLTSRPAATQDFLLLFLSSGLRWRFFLTPNRGKQCPLCRCHFWSWEHFLQCRKVNLSPSLFHEFTTAAFQGNWDGIADGVRTVVSVWATLFRPDELSFTTDEIHTLFFTWEGLGHVNWSLLTYYSFFVLSLWCICSTHVTPGTGTGQSGVPPQNCCPTSTPLTENTVTHYIYIDHKLAPQLYQHSL